MATQLQAQLPSFLSVQPNMSGLRKYVRELPQQFDTSGVEANYQAQQDMNTARGTAASAAAARAAQNRAVRTGGEVASSFAQGSMMLPIFEQNQRLAGESAQYKGNMQAQQSQQRLSAIQAMAQIRAQQLGLRTGFVQDQMRLNQQGDQFNQSLDLDRDRFGEQQRQFNMGFGFQQRQYNDQQNRMREAAAMSRMSGGGLPSFQGQITRAPNNSGMGGMEFTPAFRDYMGAANVTGLRAPQYPRQSGIQGGPALDDYESQMRQVLAVANQAPAYNQNWTNRVSRPY